LTKESILHFFCILQVQARPSPPPSWGTGPPTTEERMKNSAGCLPRRSCLSQATFTL